MGIRETLNENPSLTTGVTVGIVLLAIAFVVYEVWPSSGGTGTVPTEAYFSDDDGNTYFTDSASKIAPFDHNGKEAVLASVFKCSSGKPFVGYLQKYTPEAKKMLEHPVGGMPPPMATALLLKKPGEANKWLTIRDKGYFDLRNVKCPDGSSDASEVTP